MEAPRKKYHLNTRYTYQPEKPESNTGERIVETAGYVSAHKRIMNIMLAGERLDQARKEQFDFEDDGSIDEDFYDPTRAKGFDFDDAHRLHVAAVLNLRKQKKEADAASAASKASQDALSKSASDNLNVPDKASPEASK